MDDMKSQQPSDTRKAYAKPEVREYGSIYELTAGVTNVNDKNDMSGGPIKT